ncbi:Copia-like retrotransposable element, putative [Theobroma cacao]|uniref:Copia-like retrotransposable element, putative n=1 Tax=Theobroma cacao TaxID=3641 RepID=A0A061FY70_THECC|nr:Copia-like retrotransposable element, putative [Theobroma cacao]
MASTSYNAPAPPVFSGENYAIWSVKMEAYLRAFDLWEVVEVGGDPPEQRQNLTIEQMKQYSEEVAKRFKALSCIHSTVSDIIFTSIMTCKSAKKAWDKLNEEFQGSVRIRQIQALNLWREFEILRMKEEEGLKDYTDKVIKVVNQLKLLGEDVPKKKDLSSFTVVELVNALHASEQRRAIRVVDHSESALLARPNIKCRACNQLGHIKKVCKNKGQTSEQIAAVAEQANQKDKVLFVANCYPKVRKKETWLLNSACSRHMTCDKSLFVMLDNKHKSNVEIGNGEYLKVDGIGTVEVETASGMKQIKDVLFVSTINQNLLSVGQLVACGYALLFKDLACKVFEPSGEELLTVKMKSNCFPVNWKEFKHHAYTCSSSDTTSWHKRLGHLNFHSLKLMHDEHLVENIPAIGSFNYICDTCQYGKQSKKPFPKQAKWRATQKLQLVHTDIGGPMMTASLSGNKFYLLFIDEFSRYCWVYFLKHKAEAFNNFLKFKAFVENQTSLTIKMLRSNNGKEYTSLEFQRYLTQFRIQQQLTVPYNPQQNGVSKRKNRTLMEMARCLLFEKKLPRSFWTEAVNTANYLLNIAPTKALTKGTPHDVWYGTKPLVAHLKIFGCIAYAQVLEDRRGKLDEKSRLTIHLGKRWNWSKLEVESSENLSIFNDQLEVEHDENNEDVDDVAVRGTRSLADIYDRCHVALMEPTSFSEVVQVDGWQKAMENEVNMIKKNNTWDLVPRPANQKVIGVRWVYRTKLNTDGSVNKLKARLVVKGYAQIQGIGYLETSAPVARLDTIRLLVALVAKEKWKLWHLDVKSAFLNGLLEEDIFIEQPKGFIEPGMENRICKLKKALYGLKQAPRAWYARVDNYLCNKGFHMSESKPTLYVCCSSAGKQVIVSIYVDDILVTSLNTELLLKFKKEMMEEFKMTNLGLITYFLGLEFVQAEKFIILHQQKYATELLKKFKMQNCKAISTPIAANVKFSLSNNEELADATLYRRLIGSLLYLSSSGPDIMFSTSLLSRFMHQPTVTHLSAAKRILRYIKGSINFGIKFGREQSHHLQGFLDSDWAGSLDDSKSTTGFVFSFGSGVFSWASKKQEVVAQSSAEAEYISTAAATNHSLWLRKILSCLGFSQNDPNVLWMDNQSAIAMSKNPVQHGRTKHIQVKFHMIRDAVKNKEIDVQYCSSQDQVVYIMTKGLPTNRFQTLRSLLGVFKNDLKVC